MEPPPPLPEAAPPPPPPAEPAPPTPTFSGYIEGAWHRNFTNPNEVGAPVGHAYDTNNSFLLHAAHLAINHSFTEWASGTIEFDAGWDAQFNHANAGINANNPPNLFDVQEAYATLNTPFGLSLVAGKFVTYEGIEVIEGPVNPTVTRGFLYWLAEPVTHTGAKVHYDFQGMANVGVGLVNGWDLLRDNNDSKTLIWRVGTTPIDEFFAGVSGTYGAEQAASEDNRRFSLDFTGGVIVGPVTINVQANYGSEEEAIVIDPATGDEVVIPDTSSWYGFGVQPVLNLDGFSLGARFEYFHDDDGARTLVPDSNWMNFTITPGYTVDNFTARAEYRLDTVSEDVIPDADGDLGGSQSTVAVAIHYVF